MAEHCRILGVTHYLPLRSETKIYQRRKVTVEKPLFPGYVFASFDEQERLGVLKTNLVVRVLQAEDETLLVNQLEQVQKALEIDPGLSPCSALRKGHHVAIKAGPFMGVEGIVEAVKGVTKVLLNVELIGQAVAVEIDRDYLELLD